MASGFLRVQGTDVVGEDGKPVILRGAGLGGWMNMENFITGYPGHESQYRAAMLKALGQERYDFFFDKFLECFFTDTDARFFASKRLNLLRLPFNYRHFEDDMNPRVLKTSGFKHLDRVIDICAVHNIYTILDMHTVPVREGGQNPDWHSDNVTNYAAFWDYKDHQDRTVWLWEQIAARYKDNPWVAGYNPINEPCDPKHWRLPKFYERIEKAIRKVDPRHILWLDGNTMGIEFRFFETMLPNCVYSLHDYATMGFPHGEPYTGSAEQREQLEKQFQRKAAWMVEHKTPIWNGEFGPVYADPSLDADAAQVNAARYALLAEQLRIYDKLKIHWTIWLYKDIGLQGMVHVDPSSLYMRTIAPFLKRKRELQLDAWGRRPQEQVSRVIDPLVAWINETCPESNAQYPTPWNTHRQIIRLINQIWMAGCVQDEFAALFKDMTMEELEECARSFEFGRCVQREGLNEALEEHARLRS